jgi:hypothetical protein
MRTKTLLCLAAAAAIAIPASAQVYSANIVGYVNYTQAASSFDIAANPLNNGNNDVSVVFANGASYPGLAIYKRNAAGTGYDQAIYDVDAGGWTQPLALAPGDAFWVATPAGQTFATTFVGEVIQNGTNNLPAGFSMKGSKFPQAGNLETDLGIPGAPGDTVYLWNGSNGYNQSSYDVDAGGWTVPPIVKVAQGFWYYNAGAAKDWVKNYTPSP